MKKLTRILALAASLLAFTFIGCNTSVDDATVSGGELRETKQLKIYATSKDDVIYFSESGARTITPAAIDGSSAEYHFWLSGKNIITGDDLYEEPKDVKFVPYSGSTTEGIVNVNLDVANYELTLEVTKNASYAASEVILVAKAYADLRYNESIRFFLMPASTGKGKVQIKLYTAGWDLSTKTGYKAIAKIAKLDTDEELAAYKKEHTTLATAADSATDFIDNQPKDIDAGTYNFVVEFTNNTKSFFWSDRIVILPNQTTTATIGIPPVIGELPNAPENLYVGYKVPSNDDALYYMAEFNWEDKSNNEQNFQLDILDITTLNGETKITGAKYTDFGSTGSEKEYDFAIEQVMKRNSANATPAAAGNPEISLADASWDVLTTIAKAPVYKLDSSVYQIKDTSQAGGITYNETEISKGSPAVKYASSLAKNNTQLLLNLPLGKRYLARISAVNAAGNSAYAYAIIEGTSANKTAYEAKTIFDTQLWPENATSINVYKITYNLVGGAFYDSTYPTNTTITKSNTDVTDKIKTTTPAPTTLGGYTINQAKNTIIQFDCQSSVGTKAVIINPLKIEYDTSAFAALFKGDNKWVSWKENSTTSSNIYATETDTTKPLKAYTDYKNLNLYAAYSGATAKIYNPADYIVTKDDVILKLSEDSDYTNASVTFTNGSTINIVPKDPSAKKNNYLFILVKNDSKYSNVQIQLKETNGTIVGTYQSTGKTNVGPVYTLLSEAPASFDPTAYYKDDGSGNKVAGTAGDSWAANTWYTKTDKEMPYETFIIPTNSVKTTSFQATIQAYAGINTKTPYTYPVIFTIAEKEL